jgi:hypothetical protein
MHVRKVHSYPASQLPDPAVDRVIIAEPYPDKATFERRKSGASNC